MEFIKEAENTKNAAKNFHFLVQEELEQQVGKKKQKVLRMIKDIPDCAVFGDKKFTFPQIKMKSSELDPSYILDKRIVLEVYETTFVTKKGKSTQ